jgi:cell division protein FtsQ
MAGAAAGAGRISRGVAWPRRLIAAGVLAAVLAAGYFLWLRDSSLVAVRDVRVIGVTANAAEVNAALEGAAREMTTLHVRVDDLEAAVRAYPTVAEVSAEPSFPHGLTIHVTEHRPVALVDAGETEVPVAGDGTLLGGLDVEGMELPILEGQAGDPAERLEEEGRDQAAVLGAAPEPLLGVVEETAMSAEGVEATLEGGVVLQFGDPSRAATKWEAASRILADQDLGALTYIDLRAPERPAVGGAAPSTETPEPLSEG